MLGNSPSFKVFSTYINFSNQANASDLKKIMFYRKYVRKIIKSEIVWIRGLKSKKGKLDTNLFLFSKFIMESKIVHLTYSYQKELPTVKSKQSRKGVMWWRTRDSVSHLSQ